MAERNTRSEPPVARPTVPAGSRPPGVPPIGPRPSSRTEHAFAVGSRVLITTGSPGVRVLELRDEDGAPIGTRLPADAEVVITAWKPRRSASARYRVCSKDRIEGWVDAGNLRRLPPPPPPPQPVQPSKPVAAKPVAAKPATTKPGTKSVTTKPGKVDPRGARPRASAEPPMAKASPTKPPASAGRPQRAAKPPPRGAKAPARGKAPRSAPKRAR